MEMTGCDSDGCAPNPARPFRPSHSPSGVFLDANGHLTFSPNDRENPKNWSTARRWSITLATVSMVMNATFASSAPSGCVEGIAEHFNISVTAAQLTMTLFLLGYVAGPLVFAPLSEFYGRQYVFWVSFLLYGIFGLLCAFPPNFGTMLIGRLLTGAFVSCSLSNSPGVLADIWDPVERGNAMAVFSVATNIGPALGPIVGGFVQLKKDWRWCFYVLLWMAAGTCFLVLTLPETLSTVILQRKAAKLRKQKLPGYEDVLAPIEATDRTPASVFKTTLTRPWIILLDPISFFMAIYMTFVYMLLYMLFTIYPIVFRQRRGWNAGVGELPLLGSAIGPCLGCAVVVAHSKMMKKKLDNGHKAIPEDRLPLAIIGGIGFPISMFWFAWTAEFNSIHWAVPAVAGTILTLSVMLIFVTCLSYLTDTYKMFAASAVAANTVVRSAAAAAAPLFTQQMFDALGVGGGGSLIGGIAALLAGIPIVFYAYGTRIRAKSKFAPV